MAMKRNKKKKQKKLKLNKSINKSCSVEEPKRCLFDFIKIKNDEKIINLDSEDVVEFLAGDINIYNGDIDDTLNYFYHTKEFATNKETNNLKTIHQRERYYEDNRNCHNCGVIGHIDTKCPEKFSKNCVLCEGRNHFKQECLRIVCNRCGGCGHTITSCKETVVKTKKYKNCTICPYTHTEFDCPLICRYYEFNKLKNIGVRMSCSICFSRNHFTDDCDARKYKTSIFTKYYDKLLKFKKHRGSYK